jgi:hypothetical protein
MLITQIIVGILGAGIGFLITWKAYDIKNIVGLSAWAEDKLGPGGTISMYRLIGVIVIILSFMYMTGLLQSLLLATVGGLFGYGK